MSVTLSGKVNELHKMNDKSEAKHKNEKFAALNLFNQFVLVVVAAAAGDVVAVFRSALCRIVPF